MGEIVPWLFRSRARLTVGIAVGLSVPILGVAVLISAQVRGTLRSQAEAQLETTTELAARVVGEHFAGLSYYVESFAADGALVGAVARRDLVAATAILERFVTGSPPLTRALLTDPAGVEIADYPHDPQVIGQSFAHRDWYKGVSREGRLYVSGVYRRAAAPTVDTVALAAPLRDVHGSVVGYLVAQDTVESLSVRVAGIRPSPTGGIALIDRYGTWVGAGSHETARALAAAAQGGMKGVVEAESPLSGEPALLSFRQLERDGWRVMAHDSLEEVMAPARSLQWAALGLTVLCFLVVFVLSFSTTDAFRRQHQRLVELGATKTELTRMLVHDLRNPLTAIMSSLEMAQAELPASLAPIREDLDSAAASSRRLLAMINVLVDISRMEDGKMPIAKAPHELVALLRTKVEEYAAAAEERRLRLVGRLPDARVVASVDRELIARVVENLITNALKHTPAGGEVAVELEDRRDKGATVLVRVRDTGEGIPAQLLPKLFQKYGRSSGQKMGTPYDTGLGLVFCRMAVELHGGRIGVESEVGRGTLFSIELPAT